MFGDAPLVERGGPLHFAAAGRRRSVGGLTRAGRARVPGWLAVLVADLLVGLLVNRDSLAHFSTEAASDGLADPGLFIWWLRWDAYAAGHGHLLYTHLLDAPIGLSSMWNTSLLGIGVLLAPVTALFGAVATYNLAWLLGPPLAAWTCFVWLRRHVGAAPAFVGGLVFGFSPFTSIHLFQAWLVLVPVIAMLVENVLWRSPRPWRVSGPLLGLAVGLQLFVSSEMLVITALGVGLTALLLTVSHPRLVRDRFAPALAGGVAAVVVAALILAVPLRSEFAADHVVRGPVQAINYFESTPVDLIAAPQAVVLHTAHSVMVAARLTTENGLYLGIPLLAAFVLSWLVLARRRRGVLVAGIVAVMFFVLSLGGRLRKGRSNAHHGPLLPWGYLENHFHLLRDVIPIRLGLVMWLAVVFVTATGLDTALQAARGRAARGRAVPLMLTAVAAVACLVPLIPSPRDVGAPLPNIPRFFTSSEVRRMIPYHSVALVVPIAQPGNDEAMLWQVESGLWFAQVGGYSLRPKGRTDLATFVDGPRALNKLFSLDCVELFSLGCDERPFTGTVPPGLKHKALDELRAAHVSTVIVGGPEAEALTTATVEQLLGRRPEAELGGVEVWYLHRSR